jgi:hypothetical protein
MVEGKEGVRIFLKLQRLTQYTRVTFTEDSETEEQVRGWV